MNTIYSRPYYLILLLFIVDAGGQDRRGDVIPEVEVDNIGTAPNVVGEKCSCQGSVVAAVIITIVIFLILALLWWCFAKKRRRDIGNKPDPEAASRAAYDNPHFQGDDLDSPHNEGQTRINMMPPRTTTTQQTTIINPVGTPQAKVTTTATNTTSTLERGKSTLERVMAAVLSSSRSSSSKKSKDDSFTEPKQVIVPLQGHDFTGLGFTVHGNLKEGLYVKEVMSRGPASQSGQIIPGDRVMALTVFTDHIVFQDALTILSYASPYPVLLHLEKSHNLGSFLGGSSTTCKRKFAPSNAPATKLVHPGFRSQSHGDLAKLGSIDIKKMNMDNLVSPSSKSKGSGLTIDLPKVQMNKLVQRSGETRHSERAIDVPGVDIRNKSSSIEVNIDDVDVDKVELANVQVHRPMSPVFGVDIPDASVEMPTFHDAELSKATEKLPHLRTDINLKEPSADKIDPKVKFGIKVFPDMGFMKRASKGFEVDLERGKDGKRTNSIDHQKLSHETEIDINTNRKRSLDLGMDINTSNFKLGEGIDIKSSNLESSHLNTDSKTSKEAKFGFGIGFDGPDLSQNSPNEGKDYEIEIPNATMPSFNMKGGLNTQFFRDTHNMSENENEKEKSENKFGMEIGAPDISLPSINLNTNKKERNHSLELVGDDNKRVKSNQGGLEMKIGVPDINLPSLDIKSKAKSDESTSEELDKEKEKNHKSKKHGFKIGGSDFHLPSFNLKTGNKFEGGSLEPDKNVEINTHALTLEAPDINLPSFKLKAGSKTAGKVSDNEDDKYNESKLEFKIGAPEFHLPSLNIKGKDKSEENMSQNSDNEDQKHRSKHSFNIGAPDIHAPSFSLNPGAKTDEGQEMSDNEQDKNSKSKKHGFKIGATDFHLPSFHLKAGVKADERVPQELDNEDDKTHKSKHSFSIEGPDMHLPSLSMKSTKVVGNVHEVSENEDDTNSKSKKHGFKIGAPDIHLPSFNLKGEAKTDEKLYPDSDNEEDKKHKSKHSFNIEAPDLHLPSFSLKSNAKAERDIQDVSENEEDKNSKSKRHGFKMGIPDLHLPSFNLKSGAKGEEKVSQFSDNDEDKKDKSKHSFSIGTPDINLPSFHLKKGAETERYIQEEPDDKVEKHSKSKKHGFQIDAPDIKLPSFNLKSGSMTAGQVSRESDEENSEDSKHKHGFIKGAPDITIPSFKLKAGAKSHGNMSPESDEDEDKSDKSKHIIKIGAPDIHLPSFKLKTKGDMSPEVDNEKHKHSESEKHGFKIEAPDMHLPTFKLKAKIVDDEDISHKSDKDHNKDKSKHSFKIGTPDIHLPTFKMKSGGKTDDNILQFSDKETSQKYEFEHDFKIDDPDINLPSISLESNAEAEAGVQERSDNDADNNSKSKKHGFKIGVPDFHLPSFHLKTGSKAHGKVSHEVDIQDDKNDKSKRSFSVGAPDIQDDKNDKSKRSFSIGAPDISLPSIKLKGEGKIGVVRGESDNKEDNDTKSKNRGFKIEGPNFHLPSFNKKAEAKTDEHISKESSEEDKEDGKSKQGFKIGAPDIHIPSFKLKAGAKSHGDKSQDSDKEDDKNGDSKHGIEIGIPDIHLPTFKLKSDDGSQGIEKEKDKISKFKKHDFHIGAPDIHLPSFKLKSEAKFDNEMLQESDNLDNKKDDKSKYGFKVGDSDINIPSFKMKAGAKSENISPESDIGVGKNSKSKHGFKIGAPDIHLPSFNLTTGVKADADNLQGSDSEDNKDKSKHSFKIGAPDINLPSFKLKAGTKGEDGSPQSDNDEDIKSKSPKHGFRIGAPDIHLPSFNITKTGRGDLDLHHELKEGKELKSKQEFHVDTPTIDLSLPSVDFELDDRNKYNTKDELNEKDLKSKSKNSFHLGMPDINLPTFNLKGSDTSDRESKTENEDSHKSKHGFKIGMPDIDLPSFSLKRESSNSAKVEDENKSKSNYDLEIDTPDLNASSLRLEGTVTPDNDAVKEKSKSNYGFKIGMPDINLPSLNFRNRSNSKESSEIDDFKINSRSEIKLGGLDINAPSINLESKLINKEASYDIKSSKLEDLNLNLEAKMPSVEVEKPEAELRGTKFKLPGFGFKTGEKEDKTLSKEINIDMNKKSSMDLDLHDPKIKLPNVSLEADMKAKDREKVSRKKSKEKDSSGFGFSLKGPDINLPSFDIRSGKEKDEKVEIKKESDDEKKSKKEKKKSKEKSGFNFKFKGPDFSFPNFGGKSDKSIKESKDSKSDDKAGKLEYNIQPLEVKLDGPDIKIFDKMEKHTIKMHEPEVELNAKIPGVSGADIDLQSNINLEKEKTEEKSSKGGKFGLNFKAPDIQMPNIHFGGKYKDESIEENHNSSTNKESKLSVDIPNVEIDLKKNEDGFLTARNLNTELEAPDIALPNFKVAAQKGSVTSNAVNIEGEDVNNENFKWGLNFKGPSIGLKNKDKSVNKEKGDRDIVAEDINFKIPNLKLNNNLENEQKDEGKIHKSGINFDFNLPDFNLSKYETKPDVEDKFSDSDSKTDYDLRIKMPEIPSAKFNLKGENKFDDDNFNIDLGKQSSKINMSIPEYKLKTNQPGRIDTEQEVAIKIPHYEVGSENVEYKIVGPEMPNLNFDGSVKGEMNDVVNKSDMKSKGFGFKIKTPDFNLPDFKLRNSKNEAQFNPNDEDNSDNEDEDNNKKKKDFGFSIKMPDINLPDFMLVGNKGKSEEIKYDCSLPDELKVEAGNQVRGGIDLDMEIPNLKSTDIGMPNFSSPNISSNEKEIKFSSEKSKYPDFDLAVNLPELNMSKLGLKDDESQPTNGKIAMTVDDPSYSTDIATEDLSDYLNITDATKKKRFGFKIKTPDVTLPDFLRSSKDNESKEKELFDKNQSDEMKSYNLKLKTPNIGIESVPRNKEIEILSDEEIGGLNVKLPRVKVPNITSISSDSSEKDGSDRRNSGNSGVFGGKIKSSEIIIPKFSLKEKESLETLKYESDEWKMKEIEVDMTSPSVSLLRGKFDNLSSENISNAGEISVKTGLNANLNEHNIKLPNFDLQRKIFEEPDNADAEKNYKLKYDINGGKNFKINSRDVDYNTDEPNFIIPEMKMQPGLTEDFKIPNLKIIGDMKFDANHTKPEVPINEKGKSIGADNETKPYHGGSVLTESDIHFNKSSKFLNIDGETVELKYEVNKPIDFNVSTDLSSLEAECDLPEADSDLKKASFDFPVDVTIPKLSMTKITLEKNMNVDTRSAKMQTQHMNKDVSHEISNKFGKAFGFQGFKKHIDLDNVDVDLKTEKKEGKNMKLNISDVEILNNANVNINLSPEIVANNFELTKDLPEADYDAEFTEKMYEPEISIDTKRKDKSLPEGDQALRRNIINTSTYNYDIKNDKQYNLSSCSDNEGEKVKLSSEMDFDAKLKNKRDEEDDQSKTKTKLGLGFGFKGFGKSDSEDNDPDNKISKGPEGEQQDVKEKNRTKSKKTFSFKGFGRNSSDTEEEHTEAISENPMKKAGTDEKHKSNTKNSLNFGFKTKGSKNSDSDDNVENEKVELNPQVGHKKHKMKGNLGFGFMHKIKTPDTDHHPVHTEVSTEIIKEQHLLEEEKNKVSLSQPQKIQSRDTKYDTRSESEGGDEERMSMDSKGEDGRSKSRYGIGFGFRKNHAKNSSDSEGGETYEQKVHLDERGSNEKTKESKSKSLKLGFKGFKNLKGKIQTEINKMRHDSPSSDEENLRGDESIIHGEKRKKVSKKKDKENKVNRESDSYLDTSEEAALASAANAAKDNRRRKFDSKSSSPSSSDSSSDDDTKSIERKKKKKAKSKRKDEGRVVSTGVIEVTLPSNNNSMEISENISPAYRSVDADMPNIETYETSHVTVVRSEPTDFQEHISNHNIIKQNLEMQSNPPRYVVVREMKLKQPLPHTDSDEVHEIMDKISIDKKIPYPLFLEERAILNTDAYMDGVSWGSDSDMEKLQGANGKTNLSKTSVNLKVSGKQRSLTDSEELKRKAASLGDLSRLHESGSSLGTLLERASSLDLKNASDGHPSLHVRRLQLPDSSATSIDEADEPPLSAKKLEASGFLKAAGQWGTLEEALQLGIHSNKHMKIDATTSAPSVVSTTIVKNTPDEGAPVSNIEISGGRGSSITALSVKRNSWNESFEEDSPPSLPISPIPLGKTTITVKELDTPIRNLQENSGSDSSIVVVGNETIQSVNNNRNINIKLNPTSSDTLAVSSQARMGSSTSINSESDRYSPRLRIHNDGDEVGVVTVTMVPAESHPNARIASVTHIPPPVPPKPKANRPLSSPPELISYENMTQSSLVTVSHDWMQENGEIVLETSEHNISDEYMTPDSSPQKSMTQITLEGDGLSGYTVTEGTISRTVIISNPDLSSPISIIQTDKEL